MIKSLKQLQNRYDDILNSNYEDFQQKKRNTNPLVKTYILENHAIEQTENKNEKVINYLRQLTTNNQNDIIKVFETEDENMIGLNYNDGFSYFDIRNERFWIMHSLDYAKKTDRLHQKLLKLKEMDSVWFPSSYIYSLKDSIGELYSIGVNFKDLLKVEEENAIERFLNESDDLNFNVSKKMASSIIGTLYDNFPSNVAFENIGLFKSQEYGGFIVDTLKHNGKFTARGNSFTLHIDNVLNIMDDYQNKVKMIEENLPIRLVNNKLEGNYINIQFNKKINMGKLIEKLSSGKSPFKLWSTPIKVNEGNYLLNSIDLHMGNYAKRVIIRINTLKNECNIELTKASCGNTIFRLITNINLFIDANAKVTIGDGEYDYFKYKNAR